VKTAAGTAAVPIGEPALKPANIYRMDKKKQTAMLDKLKQVPAR
jgi:hypothetical protein